VQAKLTPPIPLGRKPHQPERRVTARASDAEPSNSVAWGASADLSVPASVGGSASASLAWSAAMWALRFTLGRGASFCQPSLYAAPLACLRRWLSRCPQGPPRTGLPQCSGLVALLTSWHGDSATVTRGVVRSVVGHAWLSCSGLQEELLSALDGPRCPCVLVPSRFAQGLRCALRGGAWRFFPGRRIQGRIPRRRCEAAERTGRPLRGSAPDSGEAPGSGPPPGTRRRVCQKAGCGRGGRAVSALKCRRGRSGCRG
jgi:hypothetical protein